jgi:histidinol dehydrogenase
VRCERFSLTSGPADAPTLAAELRALVPSGADVRSEVHHIVEAVRRGGDDALLELARRHDGLPDGLPVRVGPDEVAAAQAALDPDLRAGLELAIANVATVAEATIGDDAPLALAQGQRIRLREFPVASAGIYVPGGRAPYPSTVVMGVVTARVAGVKRIAVCAPGAHAAILGACGLCGVEEVYRAGGAHAVAALAYGTESIERVDVIAGPGNLWVQEAKRLVSADVGIDGYLGPSDVLVLAAVGSDPELVALDLLAQAEHGEGTIVVAASDEEGLLDKIARRLADGQDTGAVAALVSTPDPETALSLAEALAPEHLELHGAPMEELAERVTSAGCVFVGPQSATAFGDYVAGSNHSLPTGGSARFASALSPRHFRRRMAEVHVGAAAAGLARAGAPIARAEGFEAHALSMEARVGENPSR